MLIRPKRSDTAGSRPVADIRREGELYINRKDKQIGYLDAAGQPVDLLPLQEFVPGSTYKVNDVVLFGGRIYRAIRNVPATVTTVGTNFFEDIANVSVNQPSVPTPGSGNIGQVLVVNGAGNLVWGDPFTNMGQEVHGGTF